MRRIVTTALATVIGIAGLAGCGDDAGNNSGGSSHDLGAAVRTVPANNTTGYDPASPIYMMFNDQMDTVGFHDKFYCIDSTAHRGLQDSLMGHMFGMMNPGEDSVMYYLRMHERRVMGQFNWNADRDSCAFVPNDDLMDGTRYEMHFRTTMRDHEGNGMMNMGTMMSDDIMFGFRTQ